MSKCVPVTAKLASWRWQRYSDYRHARGLSHVPVTAPEATRVAAELPLVFVATDKGYALSVLLGMVPGSNHCLGVADDWQAGYVPAWLRTPPFRLMATPGGKPDSRTLAIEPDNPWCTNDGSEVFFDAAGQLSERVKAVFTFLTQWETHLVATQRAVDALAKRDLLVPWELSMEGEPPMPGLYRVDEKRWNALEDKDFLHLRRLGAVPLVDAHFTASYQIEKLRQMADRIMQQHQARPEHSPQELDIERLLEDQETLGLDFGR